MKFPFLALFENFAFFWRYLAGIEGAYMIPMPKGELWQDLYFHIRLQYEFHDIDRYLRLWSHYDMLGKL